MSLENENLYKLELIHKYREGFEKLFRYIPWFQDKLGTKTSHLYNGDNVPQRSVSIPVYDATLLAFVKEMKNTGFMDKNYVYIYSRYGIRTVKDELNLIARAELKDIENIIGIISRYVLGGMVKGSLWVQAVENGIFLQALLKIKEVLDVWDKPLA